MRWLPGLLLFVGCVPTSFTYTPATQRGEVARPENCAFEVATTPPAKDSEEVGQLDFYNGTEPKTVDDCKTAVAKQVCQVGGDVVIAIANDKGQYTKGTVVRYTHRTDR